MAGRTMFEELGGEPALRRIINRFVDRVFDDTMIGFFFSKVDRDRVKAKEYEFAARHLGAEVAYTGRPLAEAHAPHKIMGGQFMRRLVILQETLEESGVPPHIVEHWISHTAKLQPVITGTEGPKCD